MFPSSCAPGHQEGHKATECAIALCSSNNIRRVPHFPSTHLWQALSFEVSSCCFDSIMIAQSTLCHAGCTGHCCSGHILDCQGRRQCQSQRRRWCRCYWTEEASGQQWLNLQATHHKIGGESRTIEEPRLATTHTTSHNSMDKTHLQRRDAGIWPMPSISSIAHKTQLDLLTIPISHAWRSGAELFTTINKAGLPRKLLDFIPRPVTGKPGTPHQRFRFC